MHPVEVANGIHWVGVLDPQLRIFDVIMRAEQGTSYNAYLVQGRARTALIETSKGRFADTFLETLGRVVDPARIDYVVLNHLEPDHSGALGTLAEVAPRARAVVTKPGSVFLRQILNRDVDPLVVTDGQEIDLGGKTLRFLLTPFLHWPDTMFTYAVEDQVLFPCDFLGAHYCDDRLFNDLVDNYEYAFRYYFHVIMRPFKEHVRKGLEKIQDLPLRAVCPSHGPILRTRIRGVPGEVPAVGHRARQRAGQAAAGVLRQLLREHREDGPGYRDRGPSGRVRRGPVRPGGRGLRGRFGRPGGGRRGGRGVVHHQRRCPGARLAAARVHGHGTREG